MELVEVVKCEPALLQPADAVDLQKQYLQMVTTRIRIKAGDSLG